MRLSKIASDRGCSEKRYGKRGRSAPGSIDGLEVRRQATGQPHHLDVTLRLALQSAAGLDLVQIAVDVDLQQNAWVIARTARRFRNNPVKPQGTQIQLADKDVYHPDRIVLRDVIIEILRKQNTLLAVFTLNEALHLSPQSVSSRNHS
jgi:hypothetical protein